MNQYWVKIIRAPKYHISHIWLGKTNFSCPLMMWNKRMSFTPYGDS